MYTELLSYLTPYKDNHWHVNGYGNRYLIVESNNWYKVIDTKYNHLMKCVGNFNDLLKVINSLKLHNVTTVEGVSINLSLSSKQYKGMLTYFHNFKVNGIPTCLGDNDSYPYRNKSTKLARFHQNPTLTPLSGTLEFSDGKKLSFVECEFDYGSKRYKEIYAFLN